MLTFVLAARRDPVWNLVFFALSAAALLSARVRVRTLLLLMLPVALSALGMFFTGYHFSADGSMPVRADAFLAGGSALWNGLLQASRVLAYAGLGLAFALTTDRIRMVKSFQRQFHLPQVFAYGLLACPLYRSGWCWGTSQALPSAFPFVQSSSSYTFPISALAPMA